uniref:Germanicol synthase n=1 Tax=Rhizophora mucronata TaxID=61149 RepID=A0A2P2MRW2_RHIMU
MTHIYTPQTTMWAGRYGSLTLMLAPLRSELRRKRPARIFTRIVIRSSPAVTSSGVCSEALEQGKVILILCRLSKAELGSEACSMVKMIRMVAGVKTQSKEVGGSICQCSCRLIVSLAVHYAVLWLFFFFGKICDVLPSRPRSNVSRTN